MLPMFDDLNITLVAAEPPNNGDNVTVRYGNDTVLSKFSLASVQAQVQTLMLTLQQDCTVNEELRNSGADLFNALFAGPLLSAYTTATALAREHKRTLRLYLHTKIPELMAVPWEYLYNPSNGRWLARDRQLSLVRSLPITSRRPALPIEGTLRVLVMVSAPTDLPALNSEHEWNNLQAAADVAAIELIRCDPTSEALQEALRQEPHVFHFLGHGTLDNESSEGLLFFCDGDGKARKMPAGDLALLGNCSSLQLALLNACQGATPAAASAFAGVAQKLIQQGTPAVIAMQAPIADNHAIRFSQEFYQALANGYGVEAAVVEGRMGITEGFASWGIPTLYFQGGEPFAIPALNNAQKATRQWNKAQQVNGLPHRELIEQVLALDPEHAGAGAAKQQLQNRDEAAQLYETALLLYQQEQWREAHRKLEKVELLSPNYRDTRSLLAELLGKLRAIVSDDATTTVGSYRGQRQRYQPILNALLDGMLVPFLGWELGRVGRPPQDSWGKGHYLPDAKEIASYLSEGLGSIETISQSLPQVSQYASLTDGPARLFRKLHEIYAADYPPTILHRLLAELPARLAAKGYPRSESNHRYVYFSTAFDTLLEQAFEQAGQPYHLFAYRHRFTDASGRVREGCFVHIPPGNGKSSKPIELRTPNTYRAHDTDYQPIIVKLCGQRVTVEDGSVIVTEDQFLDYLPAQEIGALLPPTLLQHVKNRSFVFFGFSLQEWYFRLIWQRMKAQKASLHGKSWAILANPSAIEERFWRKQEEIETVTAVPEVVVAMVNEWLDTL